LSPFLVEKGGGKMIKLFTLPSSRASRRVQADLIEMGTPFTVQNMLSSKLTFDQLKEILSYTTEGTDEIIANGKERKLLEAQGVDFDKITLSELHYYVRRFPKLIKAPITIGKCMMVIGHNERTKSHDIFKPRSMRLQTYSQQLEEIRAYEDVKLSEGKPISGGNRG
jgi:regulatory protein spx